MNEPINKISLTEKIVALLQNGQKKEQIETTLLSDGHDAYFIKNIVAETVKMHQAKQRTQGMVLILIGAVVSLLSCVLTISSVLPDGAFPYVLYGLTSVGIIIAFVGLTKVF